jgi:hypothetical protein
MAPEEGVEREIFRMQAWISSRIPHQRLHDHHLQS